MLLRTYGYECSNCNVKWEDTIDCFEVEVVGDDGRRAMVRSEDQVDCPTCGKRARRLLSAPYFTKFSQPLNYKERAIKSDLQTANKIEESLAYGPLKTADDKTKTEVAKELDRRKFE